MGTGIAIGAATGASGGIAARCGASFAGMPMWFQIAWTVFVIGALVGAAVGIWKGWRGYY